MSCMTFRTLSESISTEEDQQKLRDEARRRRAKRYCTKSKNCQGNNNSQFSSSGDSLTSSEDSSTVNESEFNDDEGTQIQGKLNVRFANIQIREYAICLGDNPGGRGGPPISLSWISDPKESIISLDQYEEMKSVENGRRRGISLMLSPEDRIRALRTLGYTDIQIKQCIKHMATIRAQRRDTYAALAFGEDLVMVVDSMKHFFRHESHRTIKEEEDEGTNKRSFIIPRMSCSP